MNYKIIKELAYGVNGTVYLIKDTKTKRKYVMKIQHITKEDVKESKSSKVWHEIDFAKYARKYPNQFIQLVYYKFIDNCKHKQKVPDNFKFFDPKLKKIHNELQKSPYCVIFIYNLLDGTLSHLMKSLPDKINNKTLKILYSLMIQITYICYLLKKGGYVHTDLHFGNIMYNKVPKNSKISIFGYKIPTYGYLLSAIDYGEIIHKKYKLTSHQKGMLQQVGTDLHYVLANFLYEPILDVVFKNKKFRFPPWPVLIKNIKKEPEYCYIKKHLSKDKKKKALNQNITNYLFLVLNMRRSYQLVGFDQYADIDQYIKKQPIPRQDWIYIYSHIEQPKKIVGYLYKKMYPV